MALTESSRQLCLLVAWVIALVATLTTLYSSEVLQYPVCPLCWYQRICIYPLAIILGIATFRNDSSIAIYTIPLAIIGALFALYQYLIQMIPGFNPIHFCTMGATCEETYFKLFGFITFPFLSLIACLLIIIFLVLANQKHKISE